VGNNAFGSFVGAPTTTIKTHSVGYHWGPAQPFGWALYANDWASGGNQAELFQGDVFIGDGFSTQGSSYSALCAILCRSNNRLRG
jgi:hypothetical protein